MGIAIAGLDSVGVGPRDIIPRMRFTSSARIACDISGRSDITRLKPSPARHDLEVASSPCRGTSCCCALALRVHDRDPTTSSSPSCCDPAARSRARRSPFGTSAFVGVHVTVCVSASNFADGGAAITSTRVSSRFWSIAATEKLTVCPTATFVSSGANTSGGRSGAVWYGSGRNASGWVGFCVITAGVGEPAAGEVTGSASCYHHTQRARAERAFWRSSCVEHRITMLGSARR